MFQLVYLRFTQPRADPTAFAAMKAQALALLANQMASPDAVFGQTLDAALSGEQSAAPARDAGERGEVEPRHSRWRSTRRASPTPATSRSSSSAASRPRRIKPLVETYLASLPATDAHETWRDLGITPPTGVIEKTVEKGIAPKSEVSIVFSGPFDYDDANRLALRTAVLLLQSRLNDAIREELGGTYSITADVETRSGSRGRNTACASTGPAIPRASTASCSACSRRSSSVRKTTLHAASRWRACATSCCGSWSRTARTTGICSTRSRAATKTATAQIVGRGGPGAGGRSRR